MPFVSAFYRGSGPQLLKSFLVIWFVCQCIQTASAMLPGKFDGISGITTEMATTFVGYLVLGVVLDQSFRGRWWYGATFLALGALGVAANVVASHFSADGNSKLIEYGSPLMIIMSSFSYLFLKWTCDSLLPRFAIIPFTFLGRMSLGIFVLHLIPLEYISEHVANPLMYSGPGLETEIIVAKTILLCIPVVYIGQRIPLVRWLLVVEQAWSAYGDFSGRLNKKRPGRDFRAVPVRSVAGFRPRTGSSCYARRRL